jgi:hypothetical protein
MFLLTQEILLGFDFINKINVEFLYTSLPVIFMEKYMANTEMLTKYS